MGTIDYKLTIYEGVGDKPLEGISMAHLLEDNTFIASLFPFWRRVIWLSNWVLLLINAVTMMQKESVSQMGDVNVMEEEKWRERDHWIIIGIKLTK